MCFVNNIPLCMSLSLQDVNFIIIVTPRTLHLLSFPMKIDALFFYILQLFC